MRSLAYQKEAFADRVRVSVDIGHFLTALRYERRVLEARETREG